MLRLLTADNPIFGRNLHQLLEGDMGTPGGGAAPAAPTPTPETTPAQSNPGQPQSLTDFLSERLAGNQSQEPSKTEPAPEPAPAPAASGTPAATPDVTPKPDESQVTIPDKFKGPDGNINPAFVKSYTEMESMFGRQTQQMNQLQQTVISLQQQIAEQAQAANAAKPPEKQLSPEELKAQIEADSEKFFEDFNENPEAAVDKLVEKAFKKLVEPINQKIEPMVQKEQHQQRVANYQSQIQAAKNDPDNPRPDFDDMVPAMQKIIDEYGEVLTSRPDAVVAAYNLAKSRQAKPAQPPTAAVEPAVKPPTIEEMAQNPAVKNLVLQNHMQEIKNTPVPPVIGAQAGGLSPGTAPLDLKNMKAAKEAFKAKYAGFNLN